MSIDDKGYDTEVLGSCMTNTTPGSQHTATMDAWHLWSYAQEAALLAMTDEDPQTHCCHLVQDAERRAMRIAAYYADLYFRSKEKSQGNIQFYWVALAAFVVKDVVYAFEYTRKNVLEGAWRGEWGDAFGQNAYLHAMRTYLALAKGNLWLFMDVYPWYWFYLEYVINKDGSLNTERLEAYAPRRNSDTFQQQAKNAVAWLPYSRNWLQRAAEKIGKDAAYAEAEKCNETVLKIGHTSDAAHRYVRRALAKRNDPHDVPLGRYWPRIQEAFDVLTEGRKEMRRFAADTAAMDRLDKVAKFPLTPEVKDAYAAISKGIKNGPKNQHTELFLIAQQEQCNLLQPLIYDDSKLKESLDLNHKFSRRSTFLSPPFQVIFSAEKDTDDPELKVRFDPPEGVVDWLEGSNKSLANMDDRMAFVQEIAKKFNKRMQDKSTYMLGEIEKIRGWHNA